MRQKDNIHGFLFNVKKGLAVQKSTRPKWLEGSNWRLNASHLLLLSFALGTIFWMHSKHQQEIEFFKQRQLRDRIVVSNLHKEINELSGLQEKEFVESNEYAAVSEKSPVRASTPVGTSQPEAVATTSTVSERVYDSNATRSVVYADEAIFRKQYEKRKRNEGLMASRTSPATAKPRTKKVVTALRTVPSRLSNPARSREAAERERDEKAIISKTTQLVKDILSGKQEMPEQEVTTDASFHQLVSPLNSVAPKLLEMQGRKFKKAVH